MVSIINELTDVWISHLLHLPNKESDTGVIFLPGYSWNACSERFNYIRDAVLRDWHNILLLDLWKSEEELLNQNLQNLHEKLDIAVRALAQKVCEKVFVIWKSTWWAVALTYSNPELAWKVLLAPAAWIWPSRSSEIFRSMWDAQSTIIWLEGIRVSPEEFPQPQALCFIHANDDRVIPLKNSMNLAKISWWEYFEIQDWGHSHDTPSSREDISRYLINFLHKTLRNS